MCSPNVQFLLSVVPLVNSADLQLVLQCHWQGWDSVELFWNLGKLIQIMYNTLSWNTKSYILTCLLCICKFSLFCRISLEINVLLVKEEDTIR